MARKAPPIQLTGNVFCDWNCFTFLCPKPEVLGRGDLIVWSWSGDSKKPQSKSGAGLLRVSVWDGKRRKNLKVKRTKVHAHLKFDGESERERKLSALIPELRALKARELTKGKGGLEVAPFAVAPATTAQPEPTPTPKPVAPPAAKPTVAPAAKPTVAPATKPVATAATTPVNPAPVSFGSKAPTAKSTAKRRTRKKSEPTTRDGQPVQGTLFD
jgi:hypothetical protein